MGTWKRALFLAGLAALAIIPANAAVSNAVLGGPLTGEWLLKIAATCYQFDGSPPIKEKSSDTVMMTDDSLDTPSYITMSSFTVFPRMGLPFTFDPLIGSRYGNQVHLSNCDFDISSIRLRAKIKNGSAVSFTGWGTNIDFIGIIDVKIKGKRIS